MNTKNNTLYIIAFSIMFFVVGCVSPNQKENETQTSGKLKVSVDESYKLLLDAEKAVFENFYPDSKISVVYKPEVDVVNDLLKDSVRVIVTNRPLTKEEEDYFKGLQKFPKTVKIAYDALAFIVNKDNPDSLLDLNMIREIFGGYIVNWGGINKKSKLANEPIKLVFDNYKSGNIRYINETFKLKGNFPKNIYAVNSNEEVIKFVEKNKNAMGLLSVNWISDNQDSVSLNFLNRIKVIALSTGGDINKSAKYYKPYQAYIANRDYPMVREVYAISSESYYGLGSGFVSFLAGEKGQRIVLRSYLVPATQPIRLVEVK